MVLVLLRLLGAAAAAVPHAGNEQQPHHSSEKYEKERERVQLMADNAIIHELIQRGVDPTDANFPTEDHSQETQAASRRLDRLAHARVEVRRGGNRATPPMALPAIAPASPYMACNITCRCGYTSIVHIAT
jgi:hypothetical protein